mgnify:CR=1 FL=1
MMRRLGRLTPLRLEYRRVRRRFGKLVKVGRLGGEGYSRNPARG